MKIEMILRHVGKHRRVVLAAGHTAQRQGVGRHLHGNGPHAAVDHIAQCRLQIQHIRRCIFDGNDPVADQGVKRATDAAGPAGPVKDASDNMGRGCLAVGAGDANQSQLRRRIAVKPGRDLFHRLPDIGRPDYRNRVRASHFVFGQYRDSSFRHGRRRKCMAVDGSALHADKQSPWLHLPGIVGQGQNIRVLILP